MPALTSDGSGINALVAEQDPVGLVKAYVRSGANGKPGQAQAKDGLEQRHETADDADRCGHHHTHAHGEPEGQIVYGQP